jgi:hypothetical protein
MMSFNVHSTTYGVKLRDWDVFVDPLYFVHESEVVAGECVIDANDFPLNEGCIAYAFTY